LTHAFNRKFILLLSQYCIYHCLECKATNKRDHPHNQKEIWAPKISGRSKVTCIVYLTSSKFEEGGIEDKETVV
jgi:hypothetical protein